VFDLARGKIRRASRAIRSARACICNDAPAWQRNDAIRIGVDRPAGWIESFLIRGNVCHRHVCAVGQYS